MALRELADGIDADEYPVMTLEINRALSSMPEESLSPNGGDAQRMLLLILRGISRLD